VLLAEEYTLDTLKEVIRNRPNEIIKHVTKEGIRALITVQSIGQF